MQCPKCKTDNPDESVFCAKCGTQIKETEEKSLPTQTIEAPREELTTGSKFAGRYQIIEELGQGGMGKVYKVLDKETNEKVALKLIKPEISSDKKTIERFRNELTTARKIGHRNVCRMYDLNREEGSYYITMEYVSGEDLKSFIRRSGQLAVGTTIRIAKQVCEGLIEAHRLGVVHRDLKPSNIMIDKEGSARIMDFGIARSLKEKGITGAGVMIGTPEYMSPEQVEGKEVDQRSDIYSLGVILYEMVTGKVPFEGDTALTIAVKHKTEEPKNPKEFNSQLSNDLSRVILRCLEKDKEKRYQSAGEVLSELESIEKGIPTTEKEISERKPLTSREITVQLSPKKLLVPALLIIAIAVIGLILWSPWVRKTAAPIPSDKPSLAVMYFENNTGDETLDHYRKAISDLLITDLAQSKYLRVLSGASLFNILDRLNQLEAKSYSSDVLKEVALKGGVDHILLGNYTKAGENFRINVMLHDANTSELINSEGVEGRGEESIFAMVDELTKRIKANFNLTSKQIESDIDRTIGQITTNSPEAFKYYMQAREYFYKGDFKQSIPLMEKALEIDPEFASCLSLLASAYGNMGHASERTKYLKKALNLIDRISDRERYNIQGGFYSESEKTYPEAIEVYIKLLEIYPDDAMGNNMLGRLYGFLGDWDKAIELREVIVKNKSELYLYHSGLTWAYMAKGLFEKATEVCENYINNIEDIAWPHNDLAWIYIYQGKLEKALSEIDKALLLNADDYLNLEAKGYIELFKGNLIEAEKLYRELLKFKEPMAHYTGLIDLALIFVLQGRFRESKEQIKQAISLAENYKLMEAKTWCHGYLAWLHTVTGDYDLALKELDESLNTAVASDLTQYQRYNYYWRGHTFVKMKSLGKAQEMAAEYKNKIDEGMRSKEVRNYYGLMGEIELERKNFPIAIEYIIKALPLHPYGRLNKFASWLETLAFSYFKSGNLEKAQTEFERITALTTGRLYNGDIYAKAFYMLGKIYEQQGDTTKAIEHYEKFLNLLKDADPGIAEIEDARRRLAELKN